jgi:hypothetical protein
MRAIKKLSRSIASALFTVALSETFDWVQSVPVGERPRYSPQPRIARADIAPAVNVNGWNQPEGVKPSAG